MGLYLLNISVDSADPMPEFIPEELSFNDQESIIEIVMEMILGFEDAFKEYDDHDTEDHNNKKNIKIDFAVRVTNTEKNHPYPVPERKCLHPDYESHLTTGFAELDSPPPQV